MVACDCLSDALDAAGDLSQASDKAVLRDAKKRHAAFAKEAAKQEAERPKPHFASSESGQTYEAAPIPKPVAPAPKPEFLETNTRPRTRVVRRTPRWFDEPAECRSIRDMRF